MSLSAPASQSAPADMLGGGCCSCCCCAALLLLLLLPPLGRRNAAAVAGFRRVLVASQAPPQLLPLDPEWSNFKAPRVRVLVASACFQPAAPISPGVDSVRALPIDRERVLRPHPGSLSVSVILTTRPRWPRAGTHQWVHCVGSMDPRPQQVDLWVRVRGTPFPHIHTYQI